MVDNITQVQVNIDSQNPTPTYQLSTVNNPDIELEDEEATVVNVLDRNDAVYIQQVHEQGNRQIYTGILSIEALQNQLLKYEVNWHWENLSWKAPKLSEHISAIAGKICMTAEFRGDDFYPSGNRPHNEWESLTTLRRKETYTGRLNGIISRLLGWSADVPNMQYIPYITGGKLKVVQRGHEANNIVLTDDNITLRPTITTKIIHTEWWDPEFAEVTYIYADDKEQEKEPFTGTITFMSRSLVYEDGYLIRETYVTDETAETQADVTITTEYTYTEINGQKYISEKTITDAEKQEKTTVTSTYLQTDNDVYLAQETEVTEDISVTPNEEISRREKVITPLGNGWYGTASYDLTDGERQLVGTSMGQGATGGAVSQYTVDAWNDSITTGKRSEKEARARVRLMNGVAKARNTYPVRDLDTLKKIASALDSLEEMAEETLNCEVVGLNHVIDFDDTVTYNGNVYYLESNQVTVTPRTIRQSITAKRWYDYFDDEDDEDDGE